MKKFAIVLLLAGCSVVDWGGELDIDDACSIVEHKSSWNRATKSVERNWGLPTSVQLAIIWQESKFEQRAKTPRKYWLGIIPAGRRSSAYGYAQVIDGTWDWYKDETGKRFVRRDNFGDAVEFMGWYTHKTTRQLGVPKSDVRNQYLAYHEGHSGFRKKTYLKKPWLQRVAADLVPRERMYARQLRSCRS